MAAVPQSICLGYEHYAGIVEKLRSQLNKKENNDSVSNEGVNMGVKVNLEKSENIENLGEEIV